MRAIRIVLALVLALAASVVSAFLLWARHSLGPETATYAVALPNSDVALAEGRTYGERGTGVRR
jgi:lipopolysaccharide export system protein LptC